MNKDNFEEIVAFRLNSEQVSKINKIVSNDPEKFANISHFFRVAVIRLIREESKEVNADDE